MNPRYGTHAPTSMKLLHVSTHIIGFHFWKHSAIRIMSESVSDILFNPCGVFPFLLDRQYIVAAPINFRQRAQYYKQRLWRLCPPCCRFLNYVTHVTGEIACL